MTNHDHFSMGPSLDGCLMQLGQLSMEVDHFLPLKA